jgi:hypothetical protein
MLIEGNRSLGELRLPNNMKKSFKRTRPIFLIPKIMIKLRKAGDIHE